MLTRNQPRRAARMEVSRLAGWFMVLAPLAGLQTFPLSVAGTTCAGRILKRWLPAPTWARPPNGCMGQPVGTLGERSLELATRVFEGTTLFAGVFLLVLAVTTSLVCGALYRGRRREVQLLTAAAWTTTACVTGCVALVAHLLFVEFSAFTP